MSNDDILQGERYNWHLFSMAKKIYWYNSSFPYMFIFYAGKEIRRQQVNE